MINYKFFLCGTKWEPNTSNDLLVVSDLSLEIYDIQNGLSESKIHFDTDYSLSNAEWDSLSMGSMLGVAHQNSISIFDIRDEKEAIQFVNSHSNLVRSIDFNPVRMYELASCGDDGKTKIWDTRNHKRPLFQLCRQGHWVLSVRYNPNYGNLLITGGSDSTVRLYSLNDSHFSDTTTKCDNLLKIYDDHEDSVYAVDWSQQNSWCFGSISYDGRMIIHRVTHDAQIETLLESDNEDADESN
ncbi:hypothetical protein GJ496_004789 [Pomphorhynchus laevis]|nr:hypothetical protein GJ496_004789 [Pomphorhynchus laevis]